MERVLEALRSAGITMTQVFGDVPVHAHHDGSGNSLQLIDAGAHIVGQLVTADEVRRLTHYKEEWCELAEIYVLSTFRRELKKECTCCGECRGGSCLLCDNFVDVGSVMPWVYGDLPEDYDEITF